MQSKAATVKEYLASLPEERKKAINELRQQILKNIPRGFEEVMSYGMIGYVVPHSLYPNGYHVDNKLPLPFINIASQKNYVAFYHMALYESTLLKWFEENWKKHSSKKLDMGKCCVRFKKTEDIPFELIGTLAGKLTPAQWIAMYEKQLAK